MIAGVSAARLADVVPRFHGGRRTAVAAVVAAVALLAGPARAEEPGFTPVKLTVAPIPTFRSGGTETVFGTLRFRGGLVLASHDPRFGSLSGLDLAPDGRLVAIADTGYWFVGRLEEENGRPTGIADAAIAPLLDDAGRPLIGKSHGDAESLRIVPADGRAAAYVAFERSNVVRRYRTPPDFDLAHGEPVALPKPVSRLPRNEGLEAIAVAPKAGPLDGALVLIAEHALDAAGNHRGFIVGGPRSGTFTIVRSGEFDVTDAAFLPGGDLLVLERRFSYSAGVAMRLRRFAGADVKPGAVLDGPVQFEADMRFDIDNMEGLAVRTGEGGETIIDIVSDDNQNHLFQRTILLQFALTGGPVAPSAAAPAVAGPSMEPALPVPPVPRDRPQARN